MSSPPEVVSQAERPQVGVAVFVLHNGLVLLGRRRSRRGFGQWSTPGGHLEPGENFEQCAIRETLEEVGVEIANVRLSTVVNNFLPITGEHYVTVVMVADFVAGRIRVVAKNEFFRWGWFDWHKPPSPLSVYTESLSQEGFDPFKVQAQGGLPFDAPKPSQIHAGLEFPEDGLSAKQWLIASGHAEIAAMIDEITLEWRKAGKLQKRNWWNVLAGDAQGNPRVIAGRVFPVFAAAQLRQGRFSAWSRHSKDDAGNASDKPQV